MSIKGQELPTPPSGRLFSQLLSFQNHRLKREYAVPPVVRSVTLPTMAKPTCDETTPTEHFSHQNLRLFTTFLDSFPFNLVPFLPTEFDGNHIFDYLKGRSNFEGKTHLPEGSNSLRYKKTSPTEIHNRNVSRNPAIHPILIFSLVIIILPSDVIASELDHDCTIWHRNQNDSTLDVDDVRKLLSGTDFFDGSNRNYNKVCTDDFAYAPVKTVVLSQNNISSLPRNVFCNANVLEQVELDDNPFTEMPAALNFTRTVRFLNLAGTNITKIAEYSINGMSGLRVLNLSRTQIKDAPTDIFVLPNMMMVHLSQTKLTRLPLPPPSSVPFNVTLEGVSRNMLKISYPNSEKRKIVIDITGAETPTCENVKTVVESSYCVLAGEIVCDDGSFKKINIRLKGKSKLSTSCSSDQNSNGAYNKVTNKQKVPPYTPAPNRGVTTPCPIVCKKTSSQWYLFLATAIISLMFGGFLGIVIMNLVKKKPDPSQKDTEISLQKVDTLT